MKELFALTVLRIINLGFYNQPDGRDPVYIGFQNRACNSVYVSIDYEAGRYNSLELY